MGVELLFEASLEDFLEAEGDEPGVLWFFLHIPKTAGSSFRGELAQALRPNRNLTVDYKNTDVPFEAQREAVLDAFIAELKTGACRFASGHVHHPSVARIAEAHPKTRIVTMLRDPVARLVSDYRYQLTELHPPHVEFRKRFPTFEAYADDPSSRNKMYKFLQAKPKEPVEEVIGRMMRTYSFVGLQEMYTVCFRLMMLLIGRTGEPPTLHTRKTPTVAGNEVEASSLPVQELRKRNALDQAIYNHFRTLYLARREAIQAGIKAVNRQRLRA